MIYHSQYIKRSPHSKCKVHYNVHAVLRVVHSLLQQHEINVNHSKVFVQILDMLRQFTAHTTAPLISYASRLVIPLRGLRAIPLKSLTKRLLSPQKLAGHD